jgi:hypothetical protein
MEAWQRPAGYWLATSLAYPDSPDWSEQEQKEVADVREKERDLATAVRRTPPCAPSAHAYPRDLLIT